MVQAYPWIRSTSVLDVLTKHGAANYVAQCLATTDAVSLSSACSPMMHSIHKALRCISTSQRQYLCGGTDGNGCLSKVEFFDPLNGRWESSPSMLMARSEAICAVLMGRVCICGGATGSCASDQTYVRSAEYFDPYSKEWVMLPSMSAARRAPIVGVMDDELYVCGGMEDIGDDSGCLKSVEKLDLLNETWECAPPMLTRRANAACSVLSNCLYIAGGNHHRGPLRKTEFFDKKSYRWKKLPPMKEARENAISCAFRGSFYVFGGRAPYDVFTGNYFETGFRELSTVERFSIVTNQWESLPPMSQPCYDDMGGLSAVCSGSIYIMGANNDSNEDSMCCAMVFNPELGQWEDLPPLPGKRLRPRTWATPGFLYVCGGFLTENHRSNRIWHDAASVVTDITARFDIKMREWHLLRPMISPSAGCHLLEAV